MGLFDIFSGEPFDFNADGHTSPVELTFGFMMLDELGKDKEREHRRQELVNELLSNAAAEGLTYSPEEIETFLVDSENLGLLD